MDQDQAIKLLKKYSTDEDSFNIVLKHSLAVQKLALEIAKLNPEADIELIKTGSLLHDIGRFKCPPGKDTILHGIKGAKILRKEHLEKHALIAERHLGAGIDKDDIKQQNLPLPNKDFIPISIEEKIVTIADSMIAGDKRKSIDETIERFSKEINKKCDEKHLKLYNEVCKPKKL